MTAVEVTTSVGRPLDLHKVMELPVSARQVDAPSSEERGFSFGDFIDVINPLHHIPGIAELYRSVTNDQISDEARKTGNALYGFALGGPVGLGAMLAYNAVGDRWRTDPVQRPETSPDLVSAAQVTTEAPAAQNVPIPAPKPDLSTSPAPKPDLEAGVLGEAVATTGQKAKLPSPLASLLNDKVAPSFETAESRSGNGVFETTGASSVAYLDAIEPADARLMVLPDDTGLNTLATPQANHLPLDVLKALQERHAERTSSERS